jgi:hypothetical protein
MSFTPGPWFLEPIFSQVTTKENLHRTDAFAGHFIVATMKGPVAEQNANAQLIACAPELLEALEELLAEYAKEAYGVHLDMVPAYLKATAVIKKARGEK